MPALRRRENGEPGWLKLDSGVALDFEGVTDNGGKTFDRYTAGFSITEPGKDEEQQFVLMIGPTGNVPNGVCMSDEGGLGDDETIPWEDVPEPVQRAIEGEFKLFEATGAYTR